MSYTHNSTSHPHQKTAYLHVVVGFSGPGGLDVLSTFVTGERHPTRALNDDRWYVTLASAEGIDYSAAESKLFGSVAYEVHMRLIPEWLGMKVLTSAMVCGRGDGEREHARKALEWLAENPPLCARSTG